jgi:hypothetical protein
MNRLRLFWIRQSGRQGWKWGPPAFGGSDRPAAFALQLQLWLLKGVVD